MVIHISFSPLSWIHHVLVTMAFELNSLAQVPDGHRHFPVIESIFRSGIWNMVAKKKTVAEESPCTLTRGGRGWLGIWSSRR